MKKLIIAALLTLGCQSVIANELPEAPKDVLKQIIDNCKEYAAEDEVSPADLSSYLLNCVNEDLADQEYKTVKKLDM